MENGDRMFCHQCGGVWLRRSEDDLQCQHCNSDFTEIIEIPPDTEEPPRHATPPPASPHRERTFPPVNPFANHNPWTHDDEDDYDTHGFGSSPGFAHRAYRSPDGRFTFSSTTFNGSGGFSSGGGFGGPPRSAGYGTDEFGDPLMPMVRRLDTIFHGLADTYRQQGQGQGQSLDRESSRQAGATSALPQHDDFSDPEERAPGEPDDFGPPRLFPRNADGPQPMAPPLGTLGDILELFQQDFGQGGQRSGGGSGVRVMTGPNPLAMLSSLLNFDRHGDAVYSQEELDRVISQLVGQNASSNGPPPASHNSIQNLPKKPVDREMLGNDGKAECSICMDPVELGTEVTVLPCKHWFHYNCIEMWLTQHNTCPHCRRSIDAPAQEGSRENPVTVDSPEASRRSSSAIPGQSGRRWSSAYDSGGRRASGQGQGQGQPGGGGLAEWLRSHFGGS